MAVKGFSVAASIAVKADPPELGIIKRVPSGLMAGVPAPPALVVTATNCCSATLYSSTWPPETVKYAVVEFGEKTTLPGNEFGGSANPVNANVLVETTSIREAPPVALYSPSQACVPSGVIVTK